ncbi:Putative methyltransferase [Candidatus Bealeia paramacronuclearis]|uniref:Methyltransferase n=1 Tax=Candidatus Bealeia paramacronuclearis TaxID=1921001 RepID=A0ABZ2C1B5_9PROT|nr:putative methyltransferase [Candidatus Bealeia paramacronuclearis]
MQGKPCFYDILSIDSYQDGQPWEGLTQFLQEFLYPLMIQSYHGIDFQPLWRATQHGIPVSLLYKTLSKRDLFKRGVFKYVFLHEKLYSHKAVAEAKIKKEFSSTTFPKAALLNMISNLRQCIVSLTITKDSSVWKKYDDQNTYESEDVKKKERFIDEVLSEIKPNSLLDLGCNTGRYSFIATKKIDRVVACDLDPTCVDYIYHKDNPKILPLVLNLMTPSPAMGWCLTERKDVFSRIKVDSFLALALMHHLCITYNVPLESFVKFLRSIAPCGIVEWVDKQDPMVQFLLRNRTDIFENYTWENFELYVKKYFDIKKIVSLNKGNRKILFLGVN